MNSKIREILQVVVVSIGFVLYLVCLIPKLYFSFVGFSAPFETSS